MLPANDKVAFVPVQIGLEIAVIEPFTDGVLIVISAVPDTDKAAQLFTSLIELIEYVVVELGFTKISEPDT